MTPTHTIINYIIKYFFIKLFYKKTYNILEIYKEENMNYYNPYFYQMPNINQTKTGLFSRLFKNNSISFSKILNGTQKILGIANQAIPLVKQVGPVINNTKTMFRILNEFKKGDKTNTNTKHNNIINTNNKQTNSFTTTQNNTTYSTNNGPTFFM